MNWSNVKLILSREVRDQLRDRRTLFMIAVLPILLYPLLGMSFFQIAQFRREQATSVLVVGARDLGDLPPLVENQRFAAGLFSDPAKARLLELHFASDEPRGAVHDASQLRTEARSAVQARRYDAALYFPPDFASRLEAFREALSAEDAGRAAEWEVPRPEVIYTTATDRSQIAFVRLSEVLRNWTDQIGRRNLAARGVPASAAKPFDLQTDDVGEQAGYRGAAAWAKLLPVLLLIWALTGAFYPAIDLCAGEKERGTLETLLSSPAQRSEIVLGKLLTVMLFSMVTAVLNLISMGLTGWLVLGRLPGFGPPPALAAVWLAVALVPVAALFSALSLALAAFARSTREGQYYLMPLLLITMPLAFLPTAPGVELNLGNSLIPVTGVVLLLRSLLEGDYWLAVQFAAPVVAVTLAGCLLAIRWAVDQFNSEAVLFRESERFDVGLWVRHLLRDREPTPSVAGAVFCGVVILLARFFMSLAMRPPEDFRDFALQTLALQLAVILTTALLMTIMLTSSPRQTLLLRCPPWLAVPAAAALAVALHPVVIRLQVVVDQLYPVSEELKETVTRLFSKAPPFWQLVLVMAVVPAVCEELAFRGFILSGFRHLGHKWRAVIYSALLFGLAHAILQQSLITCLVGVVIGFLAVQSGSLLPGVIFHMLYNALNLATTRITPEVVQQWPPLRAVVCFGTDHEYTYPWPVVLAGAAVALLLLFWFQRLPYAKSPEEELQEAIQKGLKME